MSALSIRESSSIRNMCMRYNWYYFGNSTTAAAAAATATTTTRFI